MSVNALGNTKRHLNTVKSDWTVNTRAPIPSIPTLSESNKIVYVNFNMSVYNILFEVYDESNQLRYSLCIPFINATMDYAIDLTFLPCSTYYFKVHLGELYATYEPITI